MIKSAFNALAIVTQTRQQCIVHRQAKVIQMLAIKSSPIVIVIYVVMYTHFRRYITQYKYTPYI